jgi:hypothetical protein
MQISLVEEVTGSQTDNYGPKKICRDFKSNRVLVKHRNPSDWLTGYISLGNAADLGVPGTDEGGVM